MYKSSMASSLASSIPRKFKYHVFLSFVGEDTAFIDHLYAALKRQYFYTFKGSEELEKGKRIDELFKAIEESKYFIIVFSKNYISSSWCLQELAKIMKCQKTVEQIVYPLFYDVDPAQVRKQIGEVGGSFSKHNNEQVGKWKEALEKAVNLVGWDLRNRDEAEVIDEIVEQILLKLRSIYLSSEENVIGMETRMQNLEPSLGTGLNDEVRMIGIKGMGGIGKTTLARAIFDKVSSHFEGSSFVDNVREVSKEKGLRSLQERVLSGVLKDEHMRVESVYEGVFIMRKRLPYKKVLLVLDDVDDVEQLEALAGDWFKDGSRIIITTRDEKVLLSHGVNANWIHDVSLLVDEEAMSLFCRYAFKKYVPVKGYEELSSEVVRYAAGLPLTIKVLGSYLCGEKKAVWRDSLKRLETVPSGATLKVLEISYNSLDDDHKEMFLDVACFLNRLPEKDAVRMLEGCGFRARDGLRVLVRKSLLTISDDQRLDMLGPITEMGRGIVRRVAANQPSQHSRLWIQKEIEDILANQQGTKKTRGVQLLETQLSSKIVMEGIEHMEALRSLVVGSKKADDDLSCDWKLDVDRQYLPNALRFLRWVHYPIPSLPEKFRADNLVALEMPHSRITQLWEGGERPALNNLRFLDLSHSTLTTLDLKLTPRLEWLELKECRDLEDLLTADGSLRRLVHLDLIGCSNFDSLSFIKRLEPLELLSLSKLHLTAKRQQQSSKRSDNLPWLEFTCAYSEEVPSSSRCALKSVSLNLKRSKKLERLSGNIVGLQHLRHLTLDGDIPEVPNDLHVLLSLEKLYLSLTRIKCLPDSICMLRHLKSLKLKSCELLEELPKELDQLKCLEMLSVSSARITHVPDSICMLKSLKSLKLKSCLELKWLPQSLGNLQQLEKLNVLSARIGLLPSSICMLECLKSLELECCESLETLPKNLGNLKCLEKLILAHCASLGEIPNSICNMTNLKRFSLYKCDKVKELPDQLGLVQGLEELNLIGTGIRHIPRSICSVGNLRIFGSVRVLESCDFEPEIQNPEGETFCNTPVREQLPREPTE